MDYYALIDNSTKGTSTSKYGATSIAWAIWDAKPKLSIQPIRASVLYMKKNGPNKAFFEGIIRILEQIVWEDFIREEDTLSVFGDCDCVIKVLNGEQQANILKNYLYRAKDLERFIRVNVRYKYINDSQPIYRNIDQLAKRSTNTILTTLSARA